MSAADEIAKLHALLQQGAITAEEFELGKARALRDEAPAAPAGPSSNPLSGLSQLRLSDTDRWVAGVCGGLARTTGIDAWIWRLIFTVCVIANGISILVYGLLWIFVPRESGR